MTTSSDSNQNLSTGVRVNAISIYGGAYGVTAGPSAAGVNPLATGNSGGGSADLGWYSGSPRASVFVDYTAALNITPQYSTTDSVDQFLSSGMRFRPTARVTLSFSASAQSSTINGFLFRPAANLSLAGSAPNMDALQAALSPATSSPSLTTSPLGASLFGYRSRGAMAGISLTFARSTRSTWWWSGYFDRFLPAAGGTGSPGQLAFTGASNVVMNGGLAYSVSPRTRVHLGVDYNRSYSPADSLQVVSPSVGIQHEISPRWFVQGQFGYGLVSRERTQSSVPLGRSSQGSGGLGIRSGGHTVIATGRYGVGDPYGLRTSQTAGGDLGWIWHRTGAAWTLATSAGYERFTDPATLPISGMFYQGSLIRQLSLHASLVIEAFYTKVNRYSAPIPGLGGSEISNGLEQRGVRMRLVWTPGSTYGSLR